MTFTESPSELQFRISEHAEQAQIPSREHQLKKESELCMFGLLKAITFASRSSKIFSIFLKT